MLNTQGEIKFSEYAFLYDMLVPADNKYRLIDELIDFDFIYDELKDKYCLDNGRKAADPVMLFKYLMIKAIDNLSDVDVVEHSRYDLSYKRFLGLMPEDNVIDPSLLTKFRRQRLKDVNLLDMLIAKTVGVAISDELLITAQGIEIIRRKEENKLRQTLARIEELAKEYEVDRIVLGFPKNMNNTIGDRAEKTLEFKEMLERRTGLSVIMWDERLTTVEAERTLIESKVRRENRKKYVDKIAAVFILQGYLDSLSMKLE